MVFRKIPIWNNEYNHVVETVTMEYTRTNILKKKWISDFVYLKCILHMQFYGLHHHDIAIQLNLQTKTKTDNSELHTYFDYHDTMQIGVNLNELKCKFFLIKMFIHTQDCLCCA